MTTKEDYLKNLILKRWTLKDFAATIDMPYGTLYSLSLIHISEPTRP